MRIPVSAQLALLGITTRIQVFALQSGGGDLVGEAFCFGGFGASNTALQWKVELNFGRCG